MVRPIRLAADAPRRGVVLVVDDDDELRLVVGTLLDAAGFRVAHARDGAEALAWLAAANQAPTAILTDLAMPRLDGWQLVATLQRDRRWSAIAIVVMSASECPPAGVRCLHKPVRRDDLLDAIAATVDSE